MRSFVSALQLPLRSFFAVVGWNMVSVVAGLRAVAIALQRTLELGVSCWYGRRRGLVKTTDWLVVVA